MVRLLASLAVLAAACVCASCSAEAPAAARPDFASSHLALGFSREAPRFDLFAVDALGRSAVQTNVVLPGQAGPTALEFTAEGGGRFSYRFGAGGPAVWTITCADGTVTLSSAWSEAAGDIPAFELTIAQKTNHGTLLGLMNPGERRVQLPAVLHLPDQGSLRIRCSGAPAALDYDSRRFWDEAATTAGESASAKQYVKVSFPAATAARPSVAYTMETAAIYPALPGLESDPLFDGFRRNYLNIFQVNPQIQMLANNASSDPCAFTVFQYAEVARLAPPLVDDLHPLDLVRMTVDRYIAGAKGYGQPGYGPTPEAPDLGWWKPPYPSLDALPSLLISGCLYAETKQDRAWAERNYAALAAWAREIFAMDRDGNGLLEYPQSGNTVPEADRGSMHRPSNWWDTVMFGHEDAYSNALAYRAGTLFAQLASWLGRDADAAAFTALAAKLRAAYLPAFYLPSTGWLAGWKSADGQLHDYAFTFVNGAAITYGLVDEPLAHKIMDALLAKMDQAGYTCFQYGLPGNLVPIRRGDYYGHKGGTATRWGEPEREDGSDGFGVYENGGATGCWALFTYRALYQLGRTADARKLFLPALRSFAEGGFQGFDASGLSVDWRDWKGAGHGYEGFLVDNYFALLAVFDEVAARQARAD